MSIHLDFGRKIPRGQTNILARSLFRVIASDDAKVELRTLSYAAFLHHIDGEHLVPVSERSLYRYLGRAFIRHAISWWCHTRVSTRLSTDHRMRLCCYSEYSDDAPPGATGAAGLLAAFRVLVTRHGGNREGMEGSERSSWFSDRVSQPTRWC